MASYGRGNEMWIIERRGRVLWWRAGKEGARGRIGHRELASDPEAEAAFQEEQAARVAEGFQALDPAAGIDGPTLRSGPAGAPRLLTSDLVRRLRERLVLPASAGDVARIFLEACEMPLVPRLVRLDVAIAPGDRIAFEVTLAEGKGYNPDAYDQETVRVVTTTEVRFATEDEIEMDLFQDHAPRHLSRSAFVQRFRAALEQSEGWRAVAAAAVGEASVGRRG